MKQLRWAFAHAKLGKTLDGRISVESGAYPCSTVKELPFKSSAESQQFPN